MQVLHRVELQSDLVQGEMSIAVWPSLPVDGTLVILGNNLGGKRVWRDVPPPLVVKDIPPESDSIRHNFPEVFPTCAVTCAMGHASGDVYTESDCKPEPKPVGLPDLHSSIPHEFVAAQKEDTNLEELFAGVLPRSYVAQLLLFCSG